MLGLFDDSVLTQACHVGLSSFKSKSSSFEGLTLLAVFLVPNARSNRVVFFCCLNSSGQKIETWMTLLHEPSVQLFTGHLLTWDCYAFGCEPYHWCLSVITPSHFCHCPVPPDIPCSLSGSQTTLGPTWQQPSGSEVHICPSLPRPLHQELIRDHEWISMCWGSKGSLTESGFLSHFL